MYLSERFLHNFAFPKEPGLKVDFFVNSFSLSLQFLVSIVFSIDCFCFRHIVKHIENVNFETRFLGKCKVMQKMPGQVHYYFKRPFQRYPSQVNQQLLGGDVPSLNLKVEEAVVITIRAQELYVPGPVSLGF